MTDSHQSGARPSLVPGPGLAKTKRPLRVVGIEAALTSFRLAVQELKDEGWTERRIAIALSVSQQHLQDVLAGKRNLLAWMLSVLPPSGRDVVARELRQSICLAGVQDEDVPEWVVKAG